MVVTVLASASIACAGWLWSAPASRLVTRSQPASALARPASSVVTGTVGWWGGAVGVTVLGALTGLIVVAVCGPIVVCWGATLLRSRARRRADAERGLALVAMVEAIGRDLASGGSLASALERALDSAEGSLTPLLEPARTALQSGERLVDAVERVERVDPGLLLFSVTVAVVSNSGGPAGPAIERLADTLRERLNAINECRVQSAQATASASVMTALPVAFASLVAAVEPQAAHFYLRTWSGALCAATALGLSMLGFIWMDRIIWRRAGE